MSLLAAQRRQLNYDRSHRWLGDVCSYRCAAVNERAAEGIARWQVDQLLNRILEDVDASDWKVFLGGDNNFRYTLFPEYKANRRDMVKPKWLEALREHLVTEWNATIVDGYEADDALGIESQKTAGSIVASIDKDLLQIPGTHYNFVKRQMTIVNEFAGWRNFYYQVLVGDATDNISGCKGMGPVKSERLLRGATTEYELFTRCLKAYTEVYKEKGLEQLTLNAQLLYVWRRENDAFVAPEPGVESKYSVEPTTGFSESMNKETTFIPHDGSRTVTTIPKPPKLV